MLANHPARVEKRQNALSRLGYNLSKDKHLLLIILPTVLFYLLFCYWPMYGVVIAFKDFNISLGILGSDWANPLFKHFSSMVNSYYFPRLLRNTLIISVEQLLFNFPLPIIFALLLNEVRSKRLKLVAQTCSYLPHFISMVVVVGIMMDLLSTDGLVNQLVVRMGGAAIPFFNEPDYFRTLYVGSGVWQEFGWNSIIYLAAIAAVDTQQYEASIVDGAGRWKQLWYITLPSIAPTIITLLIINMGWMLNIGYEKIILMYNRATYETADVFSSYVYRKGLLDAQYSFAGAVGLANSAVNIFILLLTNAISKRTCDISIF
ncbi:MAG: ABC transporter permease subunit [Eubacteriales bacterium]|nr:ABC transporter permease subunit [Eubacteriales bacterium]